MYFNSLEFLIFFCVVFAAYAVSRHRAQNALLLVASYVFYGFWDWRFLSLLLISTVVDYWVGGALFRERHLSRRKMLLLVSCAVNLSFLGFFKYCNFFIDSAHGLLESLGFPASTFHLNIILPVGISFYTFQSMSYTIDIYRKQLDPVRSFMDFALYVAFFPQLVAGPIERATQLLPQIQQPRTMSRERFLSGGWLVFWGLFKKMVIADNLAGIADGVFGGQVAWTTLPVLLGTYAFAVQIYCDFSGYTDIARGVSRILGFELMVNFRNPYFAVNPSDFWQRWHISLSTWLRDYLYIPLGGNRRGRVRTYINLMVTMVLGGLWHGAQWTFVVWGTLHGLLLILYRALGITDRPSSRLSRIGHGIVMFHLVCLTWIFFRAPDFSTAMGMLAGLLYPAAPSLQVVNWMVWAGVLCLPLLLVQCLQEASGILNPLACFRRYHEVLLYGSVVILFILFANTGSRAFIYFQF